MDKAARYSVEIRFNSRFKGAGQTHRAEIEADSPHEALDIGVGQAVRLPGHGQAIFVTGFTVDEIRDEACYMEGPDWDGSVRFFPESPAVAAIPIPPADSAAKKEPEPRRYADALVDKAMRAKPPGQDFAEASAFVKYLDISLGVDTKGKMELSVIAKPQALEMLRRIKSEAFDEGVISTFEQRARDLADVRAAGRQEGAQEAERLAEALSPFAAEADNHDRTDIRDEDPFAGDLTYGDLRAARSTFAAWEKSRQEKG